MAFVPDASVAAAWLLPDEAAALADQVFDRLADESADVPSLFWHEIRNLLLIAERRGRIAADYVAVSLARLRQLPIRSRGEGEDHQILALARRHNLTAYDASYLALAIAEACPLASLDRRLNDAAQAEGIVILA